MRRSHQEDNSRSHIERLIPRLPWDKSDLNALYLAPLPLVGIPITIYKEIQIAKKLKGASSLGERSSLLELQKAHRVAALCRTLLAVVIAVSLLTLGILFGNIPLAIGLGLIGGALACGIVFGGVYGGLLHQSNKKLTELNS